MERNSCAVCEFPDFKQILVLERFPVFMGTTLKQQSADQFEDQVWVECIQCGCLQLKTLLPLSLVYQENHHDQPIGELWKNHHLAFAEFIESRTIGNQFFLEVGGAHGFLAELLTKDREDIRFTMVEPHATRKLWNINLVKGFIEDHLGLVSKQEVIIHSHVLEHLYEPRKSFLDIARAVPTGSKLFISIPNIPRLIELRGSNSLNFEHTYLLTESVLNYFANSSGLKILDVKHFNQHSIFFFLEKVISSNAAPISSALGLSTYSDQFKEMFLDLRNFASQVNEDLKTTSGPNFLFGAHVFTQALVSLGLDQRLCSGILDNSSYKQGKRLYGTGLNVLHPNLLQNLEYPTVILVSSHYQEEIRKQILEINQSTRILEIKM